MATNKYLSLTATGKKEYQTAITTSAGAGDAGKIPATNSSGVIDSSLLPASFGDDTVSIPTSENLSAGDFVEVYDNGGTPTGRKADASNGRVATGFVLASSTSPANALVYLGGINTGVSGLTGGTDYFLGAAGGVTPTPNVTTSGYILQYLGRAVASGNLPFNLNPITEIA